MCLVFCLLQPVCSGQKRIDEASVMWNNPCILWLCLIISGLCTHLGDFISLFHTSYPLPPPENPSRIWRADLSQHIKYSNFAIKPFGPEPSLNLTYLMTIVGYSCIFATIQKDSRSKYQVSKDLLKLFLLNTKGTGVKVLGLIFTCLEVYSSPYFNQTFTHSATI